METIARYENVSPIYEVSNVLVSPNKRVWEQIDGNIPNEPGRKHWVLRYPTSKSNPFFLDVLNERPEAFLQFAGLDPNDSSVFREDVERFIREHGAITTMTILRDESGEPLFPPHTREGWVHTQYGMSLEVLTFKAALDVYEALFSGDKGQLKKRFRWYPGEVRYETEKLSHLVCDEKTSPDVFADIRKKTRAIEKAAWCFLANAMNSGLGDLDNADLAVPGVHSGGVCRPFNLRLQIGSLLTVLWFQLAQQMGSYTTPKKCEHCNKRFLAGRSHRRFCSDACRLRNHRSKKR